MNSCVSRHIFTYGSLMFASVWESVVTGRYPSRAATLSEHGRFMVMSETYPGVVVKPGMNVRGLVYLDVTDGDIKSLDRFEGSFYQRCQVAIRCDDGEVLQADTYLFTATDRLLETPWEQERFALEEFMNTYCVGGRSA